MRPKSEPDRVITANVAAAANRRNAPVFIVGAPRSGTTMLRLMLNAHSHIAIPFESDFIPKFHDRLAEYGDLQIPANLARLLDDICAQAFVMRGGLIRDRQAILARGPRDYAGLVASIYEVYAASEGKGRWGDKDPDNTVKMDVLWELFPGCRFVHIMRDGRAVATSLRKLEWGSKNLLALARDWSWRVMLAHKMGRMLGPGYYTEVRYEDLVRAPEQVLRKICAFLEEPFEAGMLQYHENAGAAMPQDSLKYHQSSVHAPDPSKADSWRHEMVAADRALFDEVAGDTLRVFGYPRDDVRRGSWRNRLMRLKYTVIDRW
jgi:hypothetical protein